MHQVLWRIPIHTGWFPQGIPIYGFGMMLFLAFLTCTWLAAQRARREGIAPELMQDLAIWLFIPGLIGARLTYLLQDPRGRSVAEVLKDFIRIWDGGIILYGAVLGALVGYVGAWLFQFRPRGIATLKVADIAAPCVAVGICLGRLGCFLNGCCYGQPACAECAVYPVHFPLTAPAGEMLLHGGYQSAGFTLDPRQDGQGVRVGQVVPGSAAEVAGLHPGDRIVRAGGDSVANPRELSEYLYNLRYQSQNRGQTALHLGISPAADGEERDLTFTPRTIGLYPTQLYESVSMFLLFLLLTAFYPFRRRYGQVMVVLMVCYAVHRFLNEILRDDPRPEGFERNTSLILFACGIALYLFIRVWGQPVERQARTLPAPERAEPVKV